MNVDLINMTIKMFCINIFAFFTVFKIIDYKHINCLKCFLMTLTSTILTILYIILKQYINSIFIILISVFAQVAVLKFIINNNKYSFIVPALIANSIVYAAFAIATILETIPRSVFKIENSTTNFLLIVSMEFFILIGLFRIKRIRKGFTFLKESVKNEYIDLIIINISAIIILTYCMFGKYRGDELIRHEYITLVALTIFMILIIQKTINLYYKQKLLNQTIEDYKKEIKEKDETIKKLSDEKFNISKINHEFYNRQKALELKVKEMTLEAGEEITVLDRISNLTKEYSEDLQKIKGTPKLPLTDIPEIDDMFKYMQTECGNYNIDFKLQVEGNLHYLINNIIPKNKLETLIGDHIRDAIIAINSSENKYKSILAILGIKENYYEFCVYDTGIEFEIETLLKLGTARITTHKEESGSGIGFMTTFETLKECKASLIIEERHEVKDNDYTKAVIIRFDGKNEYKIRSYRAERIREKVKDNRITVEEY